MNHMEELKNEPKKKHTEELNEQKIDGSQELLK